MKVLFICSANVGRSQMAEGIFNHLAHGQHSAVSAGVKAMGSDGVDLNGTLLAERASSEFVIKVLSEIGIDVSSNKIKRLTPEMVSEADKVIVMVPRSEAPQFLRESDKSIYWQIEDPDGQDIEHFRKTRDEIKGLVSNLPGLAEG